MVDRQMEWIERMNAMHDNWCLWMMMVDVEDDDDVKDDDEVEDDDD